MSFLDLLKKNQRLLKPTTTRVTYLDGKRFEVRGLDQVSEINSSRFGFVIDEKPDDIPAKVVDYVYIGSQDCCCFETIDKFQIDFVLSVGIEAPFKFEHVSYKFVNCLDLPDVDISDVLKESILFIQSALEKQKNILVHCNAGVSRSACVVIGYLMLVCGYNYFQAFNIVKKSRSCIKPNDGFVQSLRKLKFE